jgi:hypothetical protein
MTKNDGLENDYIKIVNFSCATLKIQNKPLEE